MNVRSFPTRHDAASPAPGQVVGTDIPARLDRLPWSRFHWLVVVALGITWILDGLEVTIAGSLTGALQESPTLRFSPTDIGLSASAYLAGNVIGAALFGWLTTSRAANGSSTSRSVSIGGDGRHRLSLGLLELLPLPLSHRGRHRWRDTAINSAIQEMIPARRRGWTDLAINGSSGWEPRCRRGLAFCSTPRCSEPKSAGVWPSASARSSASAFCSAPLGGELRAG